MKRMSDPTEHGVAGELARDAQRGAWYAPLGRLLVAVARWVGAVVGPNLALIISLAIGMGLVVGLAALAEEVYDAVIEADGLAGLDRPLLDLAVDLRTPVGDTIVTGYTDLASSTVMPVIAIIALLTISIRRRSWTPAILIAATGIGSILMTIVGKGLIGRARPLLAEAVPPYETSGSFPSGHTLNAVAVVGIIAYLLVLRRETTRARLLITAGAAVFSITIGLSRVYLGHHWFTDVVAAWLLGAAWLALVITAHRLYLALRERERRGSRATRAAASASR